MAAKKKRQKRSALEGLTMEETLKEFGETHRETEKIMKETEEAMAKLARPPWTRCARP